MDSLIDGDIHKRMALTYRRASKSVFVTSITSAAAFAVAALTSDIMPIKSLGLLGSVLLLVNYFLVCTVFPSLIIIRERVLHSSFYRRCCICKKCVPKLKERKGHEVNNSIDVIIGNPQTPEDDDEPVSPRRALANHDEFKDQGCIERFFY